MDKNLHQIAKAPMIALIQTKNIMKNNHLKTNNLKTKTKRTFAALLLFALLAPTAVWAQFGGGSGTETDPYIISTTNHMSQLATEVNSNGNEYSGVYFELEADLDFSGKTYTPVGCMKYDGSYLFAGFFDGDGHTITNVQHIVTYTGDPSYIGVFGVVGNGGTVQNLTLDQSSIGGADYVGGIAGYCQGSVLNCTVGTNVSLTGNKYVGGIVGCFAGGIIRDCVNAASVNGAGEVGGIIGTTAFVSAWIQDHQITSCLNSGRIESTDYFCGGIGGKFSVRGNLVDAGLNFTVTGCANTGEVIGYKTVGGIVGMCSNTIVNNCMNQGRITAPAQIPNYVQMIGGVIGRPFNDCTISNNYYTGDYFYYEDELGNEQTGQLGGINFQDVTDEAMRGYTIEAYAPLAISLEGSIGLAYDGKIYAGNGQSVMVGLNTPLTPQCYILSAGTLVDNGNDTYTITMPAEDITISGNIVEFYGTYYEISCDGSNTATVIYDPSYATLYYAGIEDFEYMGSQYTVTAIADGAFDGLSNLEGINCHTNISSIGANAFRNCTGITYFGFYHTDTPPTVGEGAFDGLGIDTLWLMVPFCSQ